MVFSNRDPFSQKILIPLVIISIENNGFHGDSELRFIARFKICPESGLYIQVVFKTGYTVVS